MVLFSIIVPVYNVDEYLEDCIHSLFGQTYPNFELLLIDDGSSDRSGDICDRYAQECPDRVKVIHISNMGPLYARVQGVRNATGDVLLFLDADDTLRNDALAVLSECFLERECDMVLFDAGSCTDYVTRNIVNNLKPNYIFSEGEKQYLYRKFVCAQLPNSVCLKAVKREIIGIPSFSDQAYLIRHGEDMILSMHLLTCCAKIIYIQVPLYRYRVRAQSAVHVYNLDRVNSVKFVHSQMDKYISIWNMPELQEIHEVRKIRGWIQLVLNIESDRNSFLREDCIMMFDKMSRDPYFLTSYGIVDSSKLTIIERIIIHLLYERKITFLMLILSIKRAVSRFVARFRGNYGR